MSSRNVHQICLLMCSFFTAYAHSATNIIVHTPEQHTFTLEFPETVRVDKAVMTVLEKQSLSTLNIDWLGSSLFDISNENKQKQHVLRTLIEYQKAAKPSINSYWQALRNQLRNTQFGTRVFIPIDPDITRLSTSHNPLLQGKWRLILANKPAPIQIFGAVQTQGKVSWHNRFSAKSYLQRARLIDEYTSNVTVIQPDGQVENHPIAYWNDNFQEVAPGAIIYVAMPEADTLPFEQNANQLIVELLRNHIPL